MKGSYNSIAPVYDSLSRAVFGDAIIDAQKFAIRSISANSNILIIGGGTGWILEEINQLNVTGLHITYVDISAKMIALSKKREVGKTKVIFTNQSIQDFVTEDRFDAVITPFLLDNFLPNNAETVFQKIHQLLVPCGLWLYVDFQVIKNQAFWQKPFLKLMYFFFRVACNIEADDLTDTCSLFLKAGYEKLTSKTFFHSFISSAIYQKVASRNA